MSADPIPVEVEVSSRRRVVDFAARLVDVAFSTPSSGHLDPYEVAIRVSGGKELARLPASSRAEARRIAESITRYLVAHPVTSESEAALIAWSDIVIK